MWKWEAGLNFRIKSNRRLCALNIMFIIPSLCGGGAERVTVTLASELSKTNDVTIVAYQKVANPYPVSDRVKIEYLNIAGGKNAIERNLNSIKRIGELKKLKRRYDIDCAISMLYSPNFENVMSRGKEKVIVSLRSKYSVNYKGFKAFINSYTCKKADLSVALSKNVMFDQINEFDTPKDKIITIYNPCDTDVIKERAKKETDHVLFDEIRQKSDYLVITAGRLTEQKAQWHMIKSFAEVVKKQPKASLVILGEGNLKDYLQDLICQMHLDNNVFLLGFQDNPYAFLARSDVFAFTSLFEGFGNILLEAMACDLPIVSCDCDAGPRELLAPNEDSFAFAKKVEQAKYGILSPVMTKEKVSADSPLTIEEEYYADALLRLMEDKDLLQHYVEMSKRRIEDFSVDAIVSAWKDIL